MLGLLSLYTAGGLVGLLFAAFLVLTLYIYYVHWKYSHIPSPRMSRYSEHDKVCTAAAYRVARPNWPHETNNSYIGMPVCKMTDACS